MRKSRFTETQIIGMIKVVLSRIRAAPGARLGHLAFECQGALPSQC